ncbi:MAG TPA: siderophore-interacting protein [Actinospica sp.]|jgi:NADPH-dependent ferric siderophore reductase|nr:siderophore-interacting protein [Actinospica sp.]
MTYRFFDFEVARTRRVSPSVQRVTFRGAKPGGLAEFASGGRDQRFKLFFARKGQERALVPTEAGDDWYASWRAMDPDERAYMRTYTVREQRRELGEVDVDFAVHIGAGPAGDWALNALAGDRICALGPCVADNAGIDFRPPRETDWILLAGDETALPAIAGILDWLGPGRVVRAWIEIGHSDDLQDLRTWADAEITWLVRGAGRSLTGAISTARLPEGALPYAWIAGEAAEVRTLRRHLVGARAEGGRGMDRDRVTFTGYWRRGASEEDLLAELVSAGSA